MSLYHLFSDCDTVLNEIRDEIRVGQFQFAVSLRDFLHYYLQILLHLLNQPAVGDIAEVWLTVLTQWHLEDKRSQLRSSLQQKHG